MNQARTISSLLVLVFLTLNIYAQDQRSNLHVYGETLALADSDFQSENEDINEPTVIRSSISGEELIISGHLQDVEQIFIYDMNGMLQDAEVVAQSKKHMIVSTEEMTNGKYILSLERASGHESFQVVKFAH